MRKALRVSGVSAGEMAAYLGVGRNTVSTWVNGKIEPNLQTLRLWALRTGVPFEWLHHGDMQPCDFTIVTVVPHDELSARRARRSEKMHSQTESSVA